MCSGGKAAEHNEGLKAAVLQFPEPLEAVDVSSWYKSSESNCKVNYRPISVATAMSKVFRRLIAKQLNSFVPTKISNLL